MKNIFKMLLFLLVVVNLQAADRKLIKRYNTITKKWAMYPEVTIRNIQEVPLDSLLEAEHHQVYDDVASPYWTLQTSRLKGDTVVVTALVVVPAAPHPPYSGLTFTQHGWTMLLHDTAANSNEWGGILVRVGSDFTGTGPDTSQAVFDGFLNVERGDIIRITGWIEEFPANRIHSTTQFRPYPGIAIDLVGSGTIPPPTRLSVTDFYEGAFPGGDVKFSTGEKYEASLVELVNLKVNANVNLGRGTWQMTDDLGNYLSDYDASHFFTFGNESNPTIPGDTSFHVPPFGSKIDTIRGAMLTVSGGENPRGYRISPLYPGDVAQGISLPYISNHRRYPVVVTSADTVRVQSRVEKIAGGFDIYKAVLLKSIDSGPWQADTMAMITIDSIYEALILDPDGNPLPANTSVRYFIKALDVNGNPNTLANSGISGNDDTTRGFFFYTVLDRQMTIRDVQYTPYANGRSPYLGGVVSVSGIVTASSADMLLTPYSPSPTGIGTNTWYIQDGNTPWSGIWVVKRDSATGAALGAMQLGDSVTVTGTVQEFTTLGGEATRIYDSLVTIHPTPPGNPVPAPIPISTNALGNPGAEKYEGMLVRVTNARVSDVYPYFADPTEYSVDDGTGSMRVRRDGINDYSNQGGDTASGKLILHVDDRVDTLTGIVYYSYGAYKLVPRRNSDFTVGEPYQYSNGWNMISIGRKQMPMAAYKVSVLFPTAASQAFSYDNGYIADTVLTPTKGYWLKFSGNQTIRQIGEKITLDTVRVKAGWNLIGAIGDPVPRFTISVYPSGNHLSQFFEYRAGYFVKDTLMPTKGYWVKSDSDGYFVLSSSSIVPKLSEPLLPLSELNTIMVTDKNGNSQVLYFGQDAKGKVRLKDYDMPPSSPVSDVFDVRYASGRILETYPAVVQNPGEYPISISAKDAPLKVTWNIVSQAGKRFMLGDLANGKLLMTRELRGTGSAVIKAAGMTKLVLRVEGGNALPKEFSLGQNYPNPFNPTTSFQVGLPKPSHLEVTVYNVLGQKVATLVNEERAAGFHTITWNGTAQSGNFAASGVYFIRMSADKFNSVRKIMMLR